MVGTSSALLSKSREIVLPFMDSTANFLLHLERVGVHAACIQW